MIAKGKEEIAAIPFQSEKDIKFRWGNNFNESNQEKKQRSDTKNEAKKILLAIILHSTKDKRPILLSQYWNNLKGLKINLHFGCTNNILVDCTRINRELKQE